MLLLTESSQATQTATSGTSFWTVLPGVLWFALATVALVLLRKQLITLLENLSWRLRTGAAVKLFSFELAQTYVAQNIDPATHETCFEHRTDSNSVRWKQREQYYLPSRKVLLVHRIAPSRQPGMLYDVQLFLCPHTRSGSTLASVAKVEYYFGRHWGNQIFVSIDRARSFMISTSAYGPFMCTAELFFSDGERVFINRYVDFEMGGIGSSLQSDSEAKNGSLPPSTGSSGTAKEEDN
jgi:hypothetical protein